MVDLSQFTSPRYYHRNQLVHSYEVDFNQQLSVPALFNYLQDVAWVHAEQLGYGYEQLLRDRMFWVLSRVEVRIERMPRWNEYITIVTWPKRPEGIQAVRDFEIYDSNGDAIISATTSWIVLNADTRRPVRLTEWYTNFDHATRSALDHIAGKIPKSTGELIRSELVKVPVGSVDMNGHVNNVAYISWAYNMHDREHYLSNFPATVIVNFNREALYNDMLDLSLFAGSERSIVEISSSDKSRNHCKIQFEWKSAE